MNETILSGLVAIVSTSIGSFISYLVTKKKYKAEVSSDYIQNMEAGLATYTKFKDAMLEDLKASEERCDALEKENASNKEERNTLSAKIDKLSLENENLKSKIEFLSNENEELKNTILGLQKVITNLSTEIKNLDKRLSLKYETKSKKNSFEK